MTELEKLYEEIVRALNYQNPNHDFIEHYQIDPARWYVCRQQLEAELAKDGKTIKSVEYKDRRNFLLCGIPVIM